MALQQHKIYKSRRALESEPFRYETASKLVPLCGFGMIVESSMKNTAHLFDRRWLTLGVFRLFAWYAVFLLRKSSESDG